MAPLPTVSEQWQPLFDGLARLRVGWPARGWSWDSRLVCITSSFNMEFEDKALKAVADVFPLEWTPQTMDGAPSRLRAVIERTGGLRTGQFLRSAGPFGSLLPFGLWWPWRDGDTISFRIGFADLEAPSTACVRLRELFNVDL